MAITTVQIRLIADSEAEARAAIEALRNAVGAARIAIHSPRTGKRDDQWLAYGTFQFDPDEPTTITVPAMSISATATTGPTTRLAATGKTQKLRKP
jgi:hypothetical protein